MPLYNNYTPLYQPYSGYQYPQQYQQPQMVQQTQPQQQIQQVQPQNPSSILWVRNSNEAAMYPVAPNNAVALWDSGSPVIYLKQADASGKPSMKTFDLVERPEIAPETQKSQEGNSPDYATKAELGALAGVVKDIDGIIANLKEEVEAMKSEPPKKRTAVKKEEAADG